MKLDYLPGTEYEIEQAEGMFHFNSDTELLGRFMQIRHDDTVLDIGCNQGALMMYAALHKPHSVTGIDLFAQCTALAEKNMDRYSLPCSLYTGRVQEYTGGPFSVILCNPPYFRNCGRNISDNPYIAAARHESSLPLEELFSSVGRLIKERGRFYLVHRISRLYDLFITAEKYGFYPVRMQTAYRSISGQAVSVLLCFSRDRGKELSVDPPVFLDHKNTELIKTKSV